MFLTEMFPEERAGAEMSWTAWMHSGAWREKGPRVLRPGEVATKLRDPALACVRLLNTTDQLTTDWIAYALPILRQRQKIIFRNLPVWQAKFVTNDSRSSKLCGSGGKPAGGYPYQTTGHYDLSKARFDTVGGA